MEKWKHDEACFLDGCLHICGKEQVLAAALLHDLGEIARDHDHADRMEIMPLIFVGVFTEAR